MLYPAWIDLIIPDLTPHMIIASNSRCTTLYSRILNISPFNFCKLNSSYISYTRFKFLYPPLNSISFLFIAIVSFLFKYISFSTPPIFIIIYSYVKSYPLSFCFPLRLSCLFLPSASSSFYLPVPPYHVNENFLIQPFNS